MKALLSVAGLVFLMPLIVFGAVSNDLDRRECQPIAVGEQLGELTWSTTSAQAARALIETGQQADLSDRGLEVLIVIALVDYDLDVPTSLVESVANGLDTIEAWETKPIGELAQVIQRSTSPDAYTNALQAAQRIMDAEGTGETEHCEQIGDATGTIVAVANTGPDIRVDSSLAPSLTTLIADAAADGVTLRGWGWRSPNDQIRLRKAHCGTSEYAIWRMPSNQCRPPTARPGASQHEVGLAVDFNCAGRSFAGTRCWQWMTTLVQNSQGETVRRASLYGLYNLKSEPWHWSTTGR